MNHINEKKKISQVFWRVFSCGLYFHSILITVNLFAYQTKLSYDAIVAIRIIRIINHVQSHRVPVGIYMKMILWRPLYRIVNGLFGFWHSIANCGQSSHKTGQMSDLGTKNINLLYPYTPDLVPGDFFPLFKNKMRV